MELRCLLIFENSCSSKKTYIDYKNFLDDFIEWAHKDYDSLLLLPTIELEDLLQNYCIFQRKRSENNEISPNSIPCFFNGIFKFLKVNRKKIDRDLITQLYPSRKKLGGELAITTEQCKILINSCGEKRDRALIHVYCATGARPEAICELQLKHIEPYQDDFLKLVLYSDDKHEMVTFLHPEATKALTEYFEWRKAKGERLTGESFVFRSNHYNATYISTNKMSSSVMENILFRVWNHSGIKRNKKGKRYDLASITCFRKRFDTILEFNPEVSMGATQYLMDHTGYMSGTHYRRPTVEQIFEAYKKVSFELMISEEWRLKEKLQKINDEESSKDDRINFMETKLQHLEKIILELDSRVKL